MTVAQVTCTHCSAVIEQADRFCRECGSRQVQLSKRFSTVLLDDRRKQDAPMNPLIKAELVLLCALCTFVVSAVIWCVKVPQKKMPAKAKVQKAADQAFMSEIDRLVAQAKNPPPIMNVKPVERPPQAAALQLQHQSALNGRGEMSGALAAANLVPLKRQSGQPQPVPKQAVKEAEQPAPKPIVKATLKVDDVAEYNKALVDFFQRAKSSDTTDGATPEAAPAEPPSYEEWLKAGKPNF